MTAMAAEFNPEELYVYGSERELQISDIWALTCAQLGVTLKALQQARIDAQITEEGLGGYHFVQYGIPSNVTKEVIELLEGGKTWENWEGSQDLSDVLPEILGPFNTDVLLMRIRLGNAIDAHKVDLGQGLSEYFTDPVHEPGQRGGEAASLYPLEGVELEYRGRVSMGVGKVSVGSYLEETTLAVDLLNVRAESEGIDRSVAVISKNTDSIEGPMAIKLF